MEIIKRKKNNEAHPYIPELKEQYRVGRITRREFLRNATLLGMSVASASSFLASCAPPEPEVAPTEVPPTEVPPTEVPPTEVPEPTGPKRGGTLNFGLQITGFEDPATWSWYEEDVCRHVIQYLTQTDRDNITHPFLAEKWEASEDLKEWTLSLRKDVTWSTGEPFNADDVVFTMQRWFDPDVGSSTLGLMSYLTADNIEKVDDHTVKLYLDTPQIAVPEHLFHYPNVMLDHRTFEGNWLKNPVGTGYFTLEEYTEERAVLKKREEGVWQMAPDGEPVPYLDEVIFINLGDEVTAYVSALKGGQIDLYQCEVTGFQALRDDPNIKIDGVATSQTRVMRMRVDLEPWTDVRVRNAVKLCQDRQKILDLAYFGEGVIGPDCHVAPVHPEFYPMDPTPYNPEEAKALLEAAGYPDGLDVTLTVGEQWPDIVSYAQILKEDAEPAGLRITIDVMPGGTYWDVWTEADFAVTYWTHRPLAVMLLPLAYVCDEEGTPVPWNESRWCDDEFSELLTRAGGILDVEERRQVMKDIQTIQVERGSIGIPYWMNVWVAYNPKFKGIVSHPTDYYDCIATTWYDPEA
jgi:peptide/nickel transport system substrate-binding protein